LWDFAVAKLAELVGADYLIILIEVDNVCVYVDLKIKVQRPKMLCTLNLSKNRNISQTSPSLSNYKKIMQTSFFHDKII
jgi:carbamate kinase